MNASYASHASQTSYPISKAVKNIERIRPVIYKKLYTDLNVDYLNLNFKHYLLTGDDSWSKIDQKYWIKVPLKIRSVTNFDKKADFAVQNVNFYLADSADKKAMQHKPECNDCYSGYSCLSCMKHTGWWDIRTLLIHMTQCLNSSNMGNAYPQFPADPFTRIPIPYEVLSQIYYRAKELQLRIHCSTLAFLYTVEGRKERLIGRPNLVSDEINAILSTWLRFRNINAQDSQGNFIGIWEPKYSQLNQFERNYRQYCQHPPYIFEFGQEIANPRRKLLENMLHQLPREDWNHECDSYLAYCHPSHFKPKLAKDTKDGLNNNREATSNSLREIQVS
jgi:hypothetical protein